MPTARDFAWPDDAAALHYPCRSQDTSLQVPVLCGIVQPLSRYLAGHATADKAPGMMISQAGPSGNPARTFCCATRRSQAARYFTSSVLYAKSFSGKLRVAGGHSASACTSTMTTTKTTTLDRSGDSDQDHKPGSTGRFRLIIKTTTLDQQSDSDLDHNPGSAWQFGPGAQTWMGKATSRRGKTRPGQSQSMSLSVMKCVW